MTWRLSRFAAALALGTAAVASAPAAAASAGASAPRRAAAPLPAANFLVEWRIRPAPGRPGEVVITSGSAATGGESGFGPGAVVVGTARAAPPRSLRVANGREGAIRFDESRTHLVYDMSYAASSESESVAAASGPASAGGGASRSRSRSRAQETAAHEAVVHRVDGLRVVPHWTRGDTLALEVQLTQARPVAGDGAAQVGGERGFEFSSTVALSFDDWQTVATVGDGGEELQLRVSWR